MSTVVDLLSVLPKPVIGKEAISSSYMEKTKKVHGRKPNKSATTAIITGDKRKGSIGEAIKDKLQSNLIECRSFLGDVRKSNSGQLNADALIMCHGVTKMNWIEDIDLEDAQEIIDVNLFGSILTVKDFVRSTINSPVRKKIVSIGSMAYKAVLNGSSVYCASKAGLAHFMKCAAWELAPKGYDVYSIHPSNTTGTPMTKETITGLMNYRGLTREEAEGYWAANNPRESFLTTGEIAELVLFLLSGKAPYLSGSQLELGGGQR